ncbi:cyclic GMP-AMP synthase [Aplochiton taeniatus]
MAARIINQTITSIIDHLQKTKCFADVKSLPTGSYYENLKIIHPDEFDVMITIPVRVGLEVESLDEDGAFYIVKLKRGTPTLDSFQQDGTLSANKILNEFREEVKKSVKSLRTVKLERKKKGCPAVTLSVTAAGQDPISLDVVFGLEVRSSWPPFTNEGFKIENWLGTKVKQAFKRKPYYLVPKYEGIGTRELEGGLAKDGWRISFSHVEKEMIKNHGSEKTCCEAGGTHCCRKDCLKLLKHLLGLLKNKDTSLSKFCSYHAKTTFLHACSSRAKDSKWDASSLGDCFQTLLGDFESYLKDGTLPNFFIPTQNLLSGNSQKSRDTLLKHLENERANGFPIFS